MTRYENGFLTKCAQQGLSEADSKALMDFVSRQKADQDKRDKQRKALRDANRKERVRTAKWAMMALMGGLGGFAGRIAGRAIGGTNTAELIGMGLGGIGAGIGGWYMGEGVGNRDADRQEQWEDLTGQDIASQNTQRAAQIAAWNSILNSDRPISRAYWSRLGSPSRIL